MSATFWLLFDVESRGKEKKNERARLRKKED